MLSRFVVVLISLLFIFQAGSAQKVFRLINKGKYEKAEQLARRQLAQSSAVHPRGEDSYNHLIKRITQFHALARVALFKGDLTNAEVNYHRADSSHQAFLAAVDQKASNWRDYLIKNTVIIEEIKRRQDARSYNRQMDVATIYIRLGEMDTAKRILDHTFRKMSSAYGEKASMAKSVYSTYGLYFTERGSYDSSVLYYQKYILSLYSDPNYFDLSIKRLSQAYAGLAQAYLGKNDIDHALRAGKKADKFARHRFVKVTDGKNYLGKITSANLLAEVYRRKHNYKNALRWNDRATRLFNEHVNIVSPEKLPVLATRGQIFWALGDTASSNEVFRELMEVFFGYTQNNFSFLPEAEREYFYRKNKHFLDLVKGYYYYLYFNRGFAEDYIARRLYEVHINNKGVLLNSASKLLNVVYTKGDPALLTQYEKLKDLKEKKNRSLQRGDIDLSRQYEGEITHLEKQLRSSLSIEPENFVHTSDVFEAIPDSTQLVDIMKCRIFDIGKDEKSGNPHVEDTKANRYVYFLLDHRKQLKLFKNERDENTLENRYYKAYLNFARTNIPNAEVFKTYFDPFVNELSYKNLILSTDGIYNLINPEILFDGNEYLINRFNFRSVVSSKDVLHHHKAKSPVKDITLVGWPDYSTHLRLYKDTPAELPGTQQEINQIRKILPPAVNQSIYTRTDANEQKVKNIESTSVLHFATHGFFETSELKEPMHTSGLVLAISDSLRAEEDGYLTAYEASNLDLKKTFLVVLSACETGQGEFEDGEGVWGLQRAFQVAGVRYIIMSLFKVDDEVTSLLMQQFYKNMTTGDDVLQAFRKAQHFVKSSYPKPVEWGAFVIKGI